MLPRFHGSRRPVPRPRRARRRALLAWLWVSLGSGVLSWVEAPTRVQAQARWLELDARGDGCIEPDALRAEVLRLLSQGVPAGVRVQARAGAGGWSLVLVHPTAERAERELTALPEECEPRRRALSLAIALAVEHAVSRPDEPPATLEPEPAAPPEPAAAADAAAAAPEDDRAPGVAWSGEVALGLSAVELPQPAPLAAASLMMGLGRHFALELRALVALRAAETAIAGGQLSTRNVGAMFGPCLGAPALGGRLLGCAQLEFAAVLGRGEGLQRDGSDVAASGALALAAAARWPLGSGLYLGLRLEGLVRFLRPVYRVLDLSGAVTDTRELSLGGARLLLGLGWGTP